MSAVPMTSNELWQRLEVKDGELQSEERNTPWEAKVWLQTALLST